METEKETINRINRELNKYLPAKYRQSNEANVVLKNISKRQVKYINLKIIK